MRTDAQQLTGRCMPPCPPTRFPWASRSRGPFCDETRRRKQGRRRGLAAGAMEAGCRSTLLASARRARNCSCIWSLVLSRGKDFSWAGDGRRRANHGPTSRATRRWRTSDETRRDGDARWQKKSKAGMSRQGGERASGTEAEACAAASTSTSSACSFNAAAASRSKRRVMLHLTC